MNHVLIGAAAGAAATLPMTLVMEVLHERLDGEPARPLPPREVTESLAEKLGVEDELSEEDVENLTLAGHFGYGASMGAVFGPMAPRGTPATIAAGLLFGLGVWTGSYLGWLPAMGVRHAATEDPPARNGLMIAAHLVWGGTMGALIALSRDKAKGEGQVRSQKSEVRKSEVEQSDFI